MNTHAQQLAHKRRNLQLQCEQQRNEISQLTANIESRFSIVDRAVGAASSIASRPLLVLGGVAAVALIGRWRLLRWVSRGAVLFATARKVRRLLAK
jgi:hypothetical protein